MGTVTKTLTLVPSGNTGLTGMSISGSYPVTNAYTDETSTTYARYTVSQSTTGSVYFTFDTSDLPASATITSVTAKARARVSNTTRVSNTKCQLYTGTTAKGSNTTFATTSNPPTAITLTPGTWTRSELNDLRLFVGGTGSSSTSSRYIYFYGASVTITYTVPAYDVTINNSTSATVTASASSVAAGDSVVIVSNTLTGITVKDNGVDVTSQFVAHYPDTTASTDLGSFTLVSGGFNSGQSWFEGIEGNGADTTETTTSNYYSSSSSTIAVFTYDMGITIPSNAEVTRLYCRVSGHAESTSQGSEYMCAQLISGSVDLTDELNFKNVGTSNSIQTLEATTLPTVAQLAAMKLQCRLGYYGGAINGATAYVEYEVPGQTVDHYEYTIANVTADHAIVVTSGGTTTALYVKQNGSWVQVSRAYKKVNGSWTQVAVDQAFESGVKYVKG